MAQGKSQIILREAVRHYDEFEYLFIQSGIDLIEHKGIAISLFDLKLIVEVCTPIDVCDIPYSIEFKLTDPFGLSPRKKEAIYWNVIKDEKQLDVARRMGITTVSVGQYVDNGFLLISRKLLDTDVIINDMETITTIS